MRIGLNNVDVRRSNLALVLSQLHADGVLSRSELAARTGLTRSAIQGLVGLLGEEGLVVETRASSDGTPGRPSPRVQPVPTAAVALAAEIAVDVVTVATIGLGGSVLDRVERRRSRRAGVDATIRQLVDGLRGAAGALTRDSRVVGVGVAVAGQVDRSSGAVSLAPNLGWRDVELGARVADEMRDVVGAGAPVRVGNEAQLGALAEHRRGAARGVDDVLYVAGEVGVGGGLIIGGRLYAGAVGSAGEIGHVVVHPDGQPCRCGSRGCWETEVSEGALLARAGVVVQRGRTAVHELLGAASDGDRVAAAALDETARWLGLGVGSLVNIVNPEIVVLGGWFASGGDRFFERTIEVARGAALPGMQSTLRLVPAQLGADASLFGAAELAFEALLAAPVS